MSDLPTPGLPSHLRDNDVAEVVAVPGITRQPRTRRQRLDDWLARADDVLADYDAQRVDAVRTATCRGG